MRRVIPVRFFSLNKWKKRGIDKYFPWVYTEVILLTIQGGFFSIPDHRRSGLLIGEISD